MTVYEQWEQLIQNQDESTSEAFKVEYYDKEQAAYQVILAQPDTVVEGTFDELAKRFDCTHAIFAGFMDGINTSLIEPVDLQSMKAKMHISLGVDFEELYMNMLRAKADWLYGLSEWDGVLTAEKRGDIAKLYQMSRQAKSQKIARNAPCPCGSGKKYKKCCGVNA